MVLILCGLGLVCFKENEFLEFIFLTFPCLAILEKSSQWKLNSSQQKNTLLSKESVFRRIKKGKHFPFHKSRSLSRKKRSATIEIRDDRRNAKVPLRSARLAWSTLSVAAVDGWIKWKETFDSLSPLFLSK